MPLFSSSLFYALHMISNSNVVAAKKVVPEISFASNFISPETDRTDGQLAKKEGG